ncbi:hypothetical protein GCM10011363_20290 [Marivita lacus]|jgi:hypothetical protein|uniref:LPXTG cell wall anchor domain-containing protein n=1 Tax=Marivita lacus TaxID=1323742 RepID=A0ABQ1KPG2_9RHOB|nr:hypothetical protein [Marivita lacus]GGC03643.1 hypothetical protein GCM10011363_20290 [Marivita lacus]
MMQHDEMMEGMGWMMGGVGLITVLVVIFLIAGIVYFVRNSRR